MRDLDRDPKVFLQTGDGSLGVTPTLVTTVLDRALGEANLLAAARVEGSFSRLIGLGGPDLARDRTSEFKAVESSQ